MKLARSGYDHSQVCYRCVTVRSSCRSRPLNGHRVMTWSSMLGRARSETGNSIRKEKTARRFVLMLYSENSTSTERLLETHTGNTLNRFKAHPPAEAS